MRHIEQNRSGFTLVELVVVIVIAAILATVATRQMFESVETARYEQTKDELDQLAWAIVGNPDRYADGARSDFGYVGDVGALPATLDDLVQNPGGYATWDGPYVATGTDATGYKEDGWDVAYTYVGTTLRSTGSGSDIDKLFAANSAILLNNSVEAFLCDADGEVPGPILKDSLTVSLLYPDGSGGVSSVSVNPDAKGRVAFSSIPIGNHTLRVIYIPDTDTVAYPVSVNPGSSVRLDIMFPADLW